MAGGGGRIEQKNKEKRKKKTLMDRNKSVAIAWARGEEGGGGHKGINGMERRLDLGWRRHSTVHR